MLKVSDLLGDSEPEIQVVGYGMITLSQAKKKVHQYIEEMKSRADREDWSNVAHFAYGNGVLKAMLNAIIKAEEQAEEDRTHSALIIAPRD